MPRSRWRAILPNRSNNVLTRSCTDDHQILARSSPFAEMARDPLHPNVIYRYERCFAVRGINPNALAYPLITP